MIFSPKAVQLLANGCKCPSHNSPDDMIIGLCAAHFKIPIIHSSALHQARPVDYAKEYIDRLKPISFHKHYEIDPVKVYDEFLNDNTQVIYHSEL